MGESNDLTPDGAQRHEMTLEEALAFAMRHHQGGRLLEAEHIYRKILEAYPSQPDACHFLAVVSHQLGRTDEAIELLEALLPSCPNHVDLHNNLGRIYKDAGRISDARARLEFATRVAPTRPDLWNNLGTILRAEREYDQAANCYRKAIELDSTYADAYLNLGNLLELAGHLTEAAGVFRQAIKLKPDHSATYQNLSQALHRSGRVEEAQSVVREWLAFQPDNPSARHLAGALGVLTAPERASDDFVSHHFDEHAASFDDHLLELEYRAPELVGEAVTKCLATSTESIRILDAGCGTGLCGPHLRSHASVLDGVDLSAGMLERARLLGQYDQLVVAELTEFLETNERPYGLIACADTLCYFGSLDRVFAAAAHALTPEGWFVFTVEGADASEVDPSFQLRFHGRYCHGKAYVERTLHTAGFTNLHLEPESLRMETGAPVHGWIVRACRSRA